ncbi:efflux RND transporter periplasmic adaptor subunit [Aquabacterium sp.]|uniref:efflux RND transporter periplasmic adaptor subunit n=1 Tax=Aquabacterium sp. TaxID=1872578 RepID=UPI002C6B31B7|nr:efflux RND transporter periplasmic adaptor subunit [Aquabacterium sp.]HSW02944.1 efflux RND transporter periplasmic adaptor subunit [Aquabacterium sp.]
MNNKRSAVGALLVSLGLAAGLAGCNKSAAPAGDSASASGASAARAQQVVSVFTAQQRDVPVTVEAAGTVVALESVDLRPQISGVIAEVLVREGQFVKRGQTLFKLDDRADRANLERARAQLLRDKASLADLDRQWKRAQELRAQNFIAQSAADTVLANLEAQRAAVAADAAAVRSAEVALSFTSLQAPLNGRVGSVNVKPGSLVQPAGTMLLNISQIDPIGVQFSVPEAQLAALLRATGDKGDKGGNTAAKPSNDTAASVAISIPSPERGRQAAGDALQGKVVFVDNAVDTTTGSIRVKATVGNATQALWPGQYVNARMTTRVLAGAIVVPQVALIIRGNERSLYIVKADGTVEMRSVQPRLPAGDLIVVDGVQAGEKVVVEGKQNLRPGSPVKETPYTPPQRGGGAAAGAGAASASSSPNASGPAGAAAPMPVKEAS